LIDNCANVQYGRRAPRGRCAAWCAGLGLLVAVVGAGAATDTLYHFIDERGVSHFSNVPTDKRYRPFAHVVVNAPADPSVDGSGQPYAEEAITDDSVPSDLQQEHLPVSIQEH